MEKIGVVSPEVMREMYQWYLTQKQLPAQQTRHYPQRRPIEDVSPHRVFVKNTEAEVIPAYACMRVTGTEVVAGRTTVTVEKPTSTDGEFLFNSQYEIPVAATGVSGVGWAYRYGVVVMLGDQPTAAGAEYLPIVGSWEIEEGSGPFVVYGAHGDGGGSGSGSGSGELIGRFAGGGSVELFHGVILEQCNAACSTYRVQRVHRYLRTTCDASGSGSGSG